MNSYKIISWKNKETLFQGQFNNDQECLESIISMNIDLSYADLSGLNLSTINLDGTLFRYVKFSDSNFTGANLSETSFHHCDFENSTFHGVCMAYSSFKNCNFAGTIFGGTDIAGSTFRTCIFSTQSALLMNFVNVEHLDHCLYLHQDEDLVFFTVPPIAVTGLEFPVFILDDEIIIAHHRVPFKDITHHANDNIFERNKMDGHLYSFLKKHGETLFALKQSRKQIQLKNIRV